MLGLDRPIGAETMCVVEARTRRVSKRVSRAPGAWPGGLASVGWPLHGTGWSRALGRRLGCSFRAVAGGICVGGVRGGRSPPRTAVPGQSVALSSSPVIAGAIARTARSTLSAVPRMVSRSPATHSAMQLTL